MRKYSKGQVLAFIKFLNHYKKIRAVINDEWVDRYEYWTEGDNKLSIVSIEEIFDLWEKEVLAEVKI